LIYKYNGSFQKETWIVESFSSSSQLSYNGSPSSDIWNKLTFTGPLTEGNDFPSPPPPWMAIFNKWYFVAGNYEFNLCSEPWWGDLHIDDVVIQEYIEPSCQTQPSYANTDYFIGTPEAKNVAWQNTDSNAACYYRCKLGFEWSDCSQTKVITEYDRLFEYMQRSWNVLDIYQFFNWYKSYGNIFALRTWTYSTRMYLVNESLDSNQLYLPNMDRFIALVWNRYYYINDNDDSLAYYDISNAETFNTDYVMKYSSWGSTFYNTFKSNLWYLLFYSQTSTWGKVPGLYLDKWDGNIVFVWALPANASKPPYVLNKVENYLYLYSFGNSTNGSRIDKIDLNTNTLIEWPYQSYNLADHHNKKWYVVWNNKLTFVQKGNNILTQLNNDWSLSQLNWWEKWWAILGIYQWDLIYAMSDGIYKVNSLNQFVKIHDIVLETFRIKNQYKHIIFRNKLYFYKYNYYGDFPWYYTTTIINLDDNSSVTDNNQYFISADKQRLFKVIDTTTLEEIDINGNTVLRSNLNLKLTLDS
jgi:hypothetical protein